MTTILKLFDQTRFNEYEFLRQIPCQTVADFRIYRLGVYGSLSIDLVEVSTDKSYPPHYHKNSDADFYIVKGTGLILLDGKEIPYSPNQHFSVPRGTWHGFIPNETTLFVSQQNPQIKNPETGVEDIHFE